MPININDIQWKDLIKHLYEFFAEFYHNNRPVINWRKLFISCDKVKIDYTASDWVQYYDSPSLWRIWYDNSISVIDGLEERFYHVISDKIAREQHTSLKELRKFDAYRAELLDLLSPTVNYPTENNVTSFKYRAEESNQKEKILCIYWDKENKYVVKIKENMGLGWLKYYFETAHFVDLSYEKQLERMYDNRLP